MGDDGELESGVIDPDAPAGEGDWGEAGVVGERRRELAVNIKDHAQRAACCAHCEAYR